MAGVKRRVDAAEDRIGKRSKSQVSAPAKKSAAAFSKTDNKRDSKSGKTDKKALKRKVQQEDSEDDEDDFDMDDLSASGDDDDFDTLDATPDDVDMDDVSDDEDSEEVEEKKSAKSDEKSSVQDGRQQNGEAKSMSPCTLRSRALNSDKTNMHHLIRQ